ncbi:hypothetical protein AVEN_82661-1 [Araneus ventricosus]|uniref:Uncharacterized protein n=1 Tax=Araneus ventricosus TaxID=182803 RepID=A0A4Y2W1S0_ARAVE|nr:hypothetical protein AVEN_82661-1 [Araneus ventricosus]
MKEEWRARQKLKDRMEKGQEEMRKQEEMKNQIQSHVESKAGEIKDHVNSCIEKIEEDVQSVKREIEKPTVKSLTFGRTNVLDCFQTQFDVVSSERDGITCESQSTGGLSPRNSGGSSSGNTF